MQLEAYWFEHLRLKLYRDTLKNLEDLTAKSVDFLTPEAVGNKLYMNFTIRSFIRETLDWAMLGD